MVVVGVFVFELRLSLGLGELVLRHFVLSVATCFHSVVSVATFKQVLLHLRSSRLVVSSS